MDEPRPKGLDRGREDLFSDPGARDLREDPAERDFRNDPGSRDLARDPGARDAIRLGTMPAWLVRAEPHLPVHSGRAGGLLVARRRP
jgi:hypothetical protein